ncbi:hypothetical protein OCU04_007846 [Sclerotinia nivalis]|uniref:Uncharacterized protein n=1 Tax=Sclerotinia nivalis TaxID=352851 RepID=A0A9X0AN29_9HELO|nr:hypothetical protein OCU04_007846 [Sclerotinia nivalis]
MHIWAGSGSSSNGKETVRRRTRTPQKTIRGLKKRKSSASIGLGMDGSCSNGEVRNPSLSPGPSPRRDSGIDCGVAFEAESEDSIHTYDVEEDMVKPLNVGSLDSDSGRVNTIGRIEDGLKKLREKKLDKDLHDELEVLSTSRKPKGKGVTLKDLDDTKEHGTDDFSSSLSGLSRMMASNKRIFGASREREERLAATTIKDSNGNVFNTRSSLVTKQMDPKKMPPSDTAEIIQDNPQHLTLIGGKNDPKKIFSPKKVPEHESPDGSSCPGIAQGNSPIVLTASHSNTDSSESENEMERVFSVMCEQISEPESTDGQLGGENFAPVIGSVYDSEGKYGTQGIFSVRCEDVFGPDSTDEHIGNEYSTPDIKSFHTSESRNESERAFSMSCEQVPELDMDGHLGNERSTPDFKSFHNALDISRETISRNASIRGFSLRVPHLVREARQSLFTSPHFHRNHVPSPSQESMGEITSLKEMEFCASGLKNHSVDDVERNDLEPSVDDSPRIRHERAMANLEGFSSNLGSPMSLSVMDNYKTKMDPFTIGDVVESSSGVSLDGEAEAEANANDDGNFPLFQGGNISSLEYPLRQIKLHSPRLENHENSLGLKDSRQDSVERDIKNSEGFSPVHQKVLNSMTPKHSIHYTVREKTAERGERHYATMFKPISWTSRENDECLPQGGIAMERKPSQYPAKKRAFSQPGGSSSMSWTGQNFYSSFGSNCAKSFDGHGSEEWLLGNERCSESEEEMQRFWMKNSKGTVLGVGDVREEMDVEGDNDGYERQGQPGENRCCFLSMSQGRFGGAPTTIRRSIPQIDGQNSPPLLAVDSPVEPIRSPSPRKRLQKVNRSKSPSSVNKSSSSSLGKIFQNSRVEGMEGEIRDLRIEVEELKRMVDELEKEVKGVRVREESGCERVGYLGNRMEEVWGAVYGKGWDGEKVGGEGVDWEDNKEVEWTREVRDVGLFRVLGRMKRDGYDEKERDVSDGLLKERRIESYEVDLMVPISSNPKSKSKITMDDDGDEEEEFMSLDTPISLEQQKSRKLAIDGGLKTRGEMIIKQLLEAENLLAADRRRLDEELAKLERELLGLEGRRKMVGSEVESCEDKGRKEGESEFEKMRREDGNGNGKGEAVFGELSGDKDSEEENGDEQALKQGAEHFHKEYNPDVEFNCMDRDGRSIDQEGFKLEIRDDGKGKQKDGMRVNEERLERLERPELLEMGKKIEGRIGSWKPDAVEMEGLVEAGISPGNEGDNGKIRGEEEDEDEERKFCVSEFEFEFELVKEEEGKKEKKEVESLMSDLLARQEIERVRMEEWWEVERERDLEEIRGLRQMVEELKGLVLNRKGEGGVCAGGKEGIGNWKGNGIGNKDEDDLHDCDKLGCGCCPSGSGNGGRGGKGGKSGKASNVANMRKRDVCSFEDEGREGDCEEERDGGYEHEHGNGNGNGKGFWDWVGGGILWRQD